MPAKVYLPAKRKYRNQPCEVDGIRFDSKREAKRYVELTLLQQAGKISGLIADKAKLRFPLAVKGHDICAYVADFAYVDENNEPAWEDVKGVRTREYRIKKKLMKAIYGIEIKEI